MLPELIVMLTQNDLTVPNAETLFEQCRHSSARCWGVKEHPLPQADMHRLCRRMKDCGKTTFLEVVAYSEEEGMAGARMAVDCGFDVLMGTCYHDSINDYCQQHHLRYMPFVGTINGRPSVLSGTVDDIVAQARHCIAQGVAGIDLLAYRFTGDAIELSRSVIAATQAPVCLAGSIYSYARLDEVCESNPWAFTIGSAFFDKKFGNELSEQIDNVCNYINRKQ